jgi:heme O synthase-like polyprenyltransferase
MSKRQWLCIIGVWIMLFMFLGLPYPWHEVIAVVSGLLIIFIAYNLPHEKRSDEQNANSVFTENNNHSSHI